MEPRYEEGETVFVHPGKPPRRGDYVVLQVRESSDTIVGYIKRLVSMDPERIVVRQFNPPKEIAFDRREVLKVERIVWSSSE